MTVAFYNHGRVKHGHERAALLELARAMRDEFGPRREHFVLAADVHFQGGEADALILTERAIILAELKNCSAPVTGGENGPWRIGETGRTLKGGRYENPYQQVRAYRSALIGLLTGRRSKFLDSGRAAALRNRFHQISVAILFSPTQHPDNRIRLPSGVCKWLCLGGLDQATGLVWARESRVGLRKGEMERLLGFLGCRPWADLPLEPSPVGMLWMLDEWGNKLRARAVSGAMTIGRSLECDLILPAGRTRVSRKHARISVLGEIVRLYDSGSTHGTFVEGEAVDGIGGRALNNGEVIELGGSAATAKAAQLVFERRVLVGGETTTT